MIGLCLFLIQVPFLDAQKIHWINSIDWGKELAQDRNQLIVIDFWAYWCSPCVKMDKDVWRDPSILALEEDFIYVKYDLSAGFNFATPYNISKIPTIMITDSWGKILYKNVGYMNKSSMLKILSSIPKNVSNINAMLKIYHEDKRDFNKALNVAIAYQEHCDTLTYTAKRIFLSESYEYFRLAKKLCDKESDKDLIEQIELLKSLNLVYSGNAKSAIKYIMEKIGIENVLEVNEALAYYILVKGHLKLNDPGMAREYFTDLQKCDNCNTYVESVRSALGE
jgi:thiol-disulfide isomerase/thioredoxin